MNALLVVLGCLLAAPVWAASSGDAPRAGSPRKPEAPKVGVLDFTASPGATEEAAAAGGIVANELSRLGAFEVITSSGIRDLLALERQKQVLGCADESCLSEIGGALGFEYLVSGRVNKVGSGPRGSTFTLELTLSSVKKAKRESSDVVTATSEPELLSLAARSVHRLMAPLLKDRVGWLVLTSSEAGATVTVDDALTGTTPLPGRIALAAGPHVVTLRKEGFVVSQREVTIETGQVREEAASMVPSPDFIREYEGRAFRMRLGAWVSTGVAVAGVAAVGLFQLSADRTYGNAATPGTFQYDRAKIEAGIEADDQTSYRDEAERLKTQFTGMERLSYIAAGVGGAAAISAVYFWIAGEAPGRYDRYHDVTVNPPAVSLVPTPGGAFGSVSLQF